MSEEAEKIKKFVAFKKKLEKKVEGLESELNEQRLMLEAVNSILLEKGFKRAEIAKTPVTAEVSPVKEEALVELPPQPSAKDEKVIPLKAVTGEPLATLYIDEDSLRIVLSEDKNFNINTPPFAQFLVERVLAKMQEKDSELARAGQLTTDKIFSYNIVQEADIIHEMVIKNFDANRLRELKSSIRWTLEKMYEKTKG
jgi:hypothetical protein